MSECTKRLKKIIRSHGLNNTSTNVLMAYFKIMKYECLLTHEKKCFLKNNDELIDFDGFNPYDRWNLIPPRKKPIAPQLTYINRSAEKLIYLQNNDILKFHILDKKNNIWADADTLQWAIIYLLEKQKDS